MYMHMFNSALIVCVCISSRVSSPEHVKNNFMPPSNLGIVFAPNLLRQR